MTVTSSSSTVAYDASAIQLGVPLAYNFEVFSRGDIGVFYGITQLTLDTHYSAAVATDFSSATVTPLAALVALVAQTPGQRLRLQRDMDFTQDIDLSVNSALPETSLENALDRAVMRDQQLAQAIGDVAIPPAAAYQFALSYFGALAADPGVRPLDGSALQTGDAYYNTLANRQRIFINGMWGNAAVTSDELAQTGFRLPGDVFMSGRITPAPYTDFAYGQPVLRTRYPKALAALTVVAAADFAANVVVLQNVTKDLRGLGLYGAAIEGPNGFAAVISSLTATTITLDRVSSVTASGAQLTIFPHGNGDGATTYNLPDMRGRVGVGRDDMGGTAAGVTPVGTYPFGSRLGQGGGEPGHLLSAGELPVTQLTATVTATQAPHTHTLVTNDPPLNGVSGTSYGAVTSSSQKTTSSAQPVITASATISPFGGGLVHNNMQPSRGMNYFVFLGE